uniref:Uncharacterized protein n=1 Tax=Anguilla anguilla TaxID=7936 RepID=A0A0E9WCA1_ANGAN
MAITDFLSAEIQILTDSISQYNYVLSTSSQCENNEEYAHPTLSICTHPSMLPCPV